MTTEHAEPDLFGHHFNRPADHYKRDVNVIQHALDQAVEFLCVSRGLSAQAAKDFLVANLKPGGAFPFKDPKIEYLERQDNGDREKKTTTLNRYLATSLARNELIAPTFTTYLPASVKRSILSQYIEENIALRSKAKKAQFAAKGAKNKELEAVKKVEQTGRKLGNNAISGAHVSASTPLYNKTAHSTLTSTCRTTSGYGNANNEKFLSGNRHYYNVQVVLNNLVSVTTHVDYAQIEAVMARLGLHYPSVEDTLSVIKYSTKLYWWDTQAFEHIADYVKKLSPLQRAAFVYVGDAWHLMQFNPEMMRTFLTRLSDKIEGTHPNPDHPVHQAPEGYVNLAHQICTEETRGVEKTNYGKIKDTPAYHTLALTIDNIARTVVDYKDLIEAFWMTSNLPASVAHLPHSVRRSALTSDTDSTIFTVQDWVIWYSGRPAFDPRSFSVYCAVVFLASATITHILATMSANFGIEQQHLFKIAMKSEYSFPVFVPTQLGKHYFAAMSCQEGLVFEELAYEIKGAQLKSANSPRLVIQEADAMERDIIASVMKEEKISLEAYLTRIANVERQIIASIRKGELHYLRNGSIKNIKSYAGETPSDTPYAHHFLWSEVFAPKYGQMPAPPYNTKKISVDLATPTKLKAWLDAMDDGALKERLLRYLTKNNKNNLTTFQLPVDILMVSGIPKEIEQVIHYEKLVLDLVRPLYILAETLGAYALGDRVRKAFYLNGF